MNFEQRQYTICIYNYLVLEDSGSSFKIPIGWSDSGSILLKRLSFADGIFLINVCATVDWVISFSSVGICGSGSILLNRRSLPRFTFSSCAQLTAKQEAIISTIIHRWPDAMMECTRRTQNVAKYLLFIL